MNKKIKIPNRILSLILAVLIFFSMFCVTPVPASAATATKAERCYDIALVFDNSGSMYMGGSMAWCRAKYAMEIFASMLDYQDGDKLTIFPMWEIVTDGSLHDSVGSYAPISITSKEDIDLISNIYTTNPSNTPFAPVTEAAEYLQSSNATDKWIIVLTDGIFNLDTRDVKEKPRDKSAGELENLLVDISKKGINVQYLGFDKAPSLISDKNNNFYAKKSDDKSLKKDLVDICNVIFERSELPANRLDGKKLKLDMSMGKLIVFAQGMDAKIVSLTNSKGDNIPIMLDSGQRKYSQIKANKYPDAGVDNTLAGQVVIFSACAADEYTLNYSGADSIEIFYEPDVDIAVELINSDGVVVDGSSEEIGAGTYTINAKIVDRITGEDVTHHELMGNEVDIKIYVKPSEDSDYKEYPNGSQIELEPNTTMDILIVGTYLKEYRITSEDSPNLDWLRNLFIKPDVVDFKIDAETIQSWYEIDKHEEWKPIKVDVTVDDMPLTDEQLATVELVVNTSKLLTYWYEIVPGESAFNIYIGHDKEGNFVKPETDKYKMDISAVYINEFDTESRSDDEVSFDIKPYSKIWVYLFWILVILAVLLIWLMFMLKKVLPKSMDKDTAKFWTISAGDLDGDTVEFKYNAKNKLISINGPSSVEYDEQCSATFSLKPVDNRFVASKRRRCVVVGINSTCEKIKLSATEYVNVNGKWVKSTQVKAAESGKEVPALEHVLSCSPQFELCRAPGGVLSSTLSCRAKTKK